MTRFIVPLFVIAAWGGMILPANSSAHAPQPAPRKPTVETIIMVVSGTHDRDGLLRVNLYTGPDGFPADTSKACQRRDILLKSLSVNTPLDPVRVTFESVPHFSEAKFTLTAGETRIIAFRVRH